MRITFESVVRQRVVKFDCPCCGKANRQRTMRVENTVNPYNVGDDGFPLSRREVGDQAAKELAKRVSGFLAAPMCRACEDSLSYDARQELLARRFLEGGAA